MTLLWFFVWPSPPHDVREEFAEMFQLHPLFADLFAKHGKIAAHLVAFLGDIVRYVVDALQYPDDIEEGDDAEHSSEKDGYRGHHEKDVHLEEFVHWYKYKVSSIKYQVASSEKCLS